MAEAILPITIRADVGLIINDHLSIAASSVLSFAISARKISSAKATHVSSL